ncbi:PREDICTED: uncharacterized protein LOC105368396 [Ceratosolen solmsi marchali]|uniref:Uncharacterized protein LOC105368396 n=1 Tax=Ceratosolen solmsi marchali TaxID=326594 RepID=A0AAJ6YWI6_9HYME|nr:PREDICTED: uncharacterized protein LOC105368396 [Ceratosolen solmsi marchali]
MLKVVHTTCNLCTAHLQTSFFNIRYKSQIYERIHSWKIQLQQANKAISKSYKKIQNKKIYQNKEIIATLLKKHGIVTSVSINEKKIFKQSSWTIEKRIMLLQELGVSNITPFYINELDKGMRLPIHLFKANTLLNTNTRLSKNLLSSISNTMYTHKYISESPNITMKRLYTNCLIHYLRREEQFSYDQLRFLHIKAKWLGYNSFRLIKETIKFIKNDLKFTNAQIAKNHCLLNYHPEKVKIIYNEIYKHFKENSNKIILAHSKLLNMELCDLQKFIRVLQKYNIKTDKIQTYPFILQHNHKDLERKIKTIINNPLTKVYKKHPRFLNLVTHYFSVVPRLQYLEDNNIQFFNLTGLTEKAAFCNLLKSMKYKLTKSCLFYFLEKEFKYDTGALMVIIQKHPYWMYVSLVQMYESLHYLRQKFSDSIIRDHIYAILYKKKDIQSEVESRRPEYRNLRKNQQLGVIIYNIEKKCNFTGAVVLSIDNDTS